jgi:hypothetical protein
VHGQKGYFGAYGAGVDAAGRSAMPRQRIITNWKNDNNPMARVGAE